MLPTPNDHYDPIRNRWVSYNMDLTEHFNTEEIFAIPNSISGCKHFNLSEIVQQKSAIAAKKQNRDGCVAQNVPGVTSFKFNWTTYHDVVCSLVLGSLVSKL